MRETASTFKLKDINNKITELADKLNEVDTNILGLENDAQKLKNEL